MNPLHLIEIVSGLRCEQRGAEQPIEAVTYDSRRCGPNVMFVALVGSTADGHAFLKNAYELGCRCALVSKDVDVPEDMTVLRASDTRAVLGLVAAEVYGNPSARLTVIGVTGTNGKTTCAALIEQILGAQGLSVGVFGTLNVRWPGHVVEAINTTPESCVLQDLMAQMLADGVTHVVMEVSSHGLATHRLNGTLFDVAVFTNLTQDHLDFHENMEAYRDAKFRLFLDVLPVSAVRGKVPRSIVNLADSAGQLLFQKLDKKALTFGAPKTDLWAEEVQFTTAETQVRLTSSFDALNGRRAASPLHGDFNVENLLAATLACIACGIETEQVIESWKELESPAGRLQVAGRGIFVDYAHTPDALERALLALRTMNPKRVIVVFGCGGERDRGKRAPMGRVASELADIVVLTSDNPRGEDPEAILDEIEKGIRSSEQNVHRFSDRREAIRVAVGMMGEGDILLVAGKGHETYQEVNGRRHRLDDVEEVQRAGAACGQ